MWYLIAESNGLTSSSALIAGQRLIIPNKVTNFHNNAGTFRVYDPGEAIGDTLPTLPMEPAPPPAHPNAKKGCGGFGNILLATVAIAVAAILPPVAGLGPVLGGAVNAAAASIASQGVGLATGLQDKFSWKGVGLAAVAGGVGGALGSGGLFKSDGLFGGMGSKVVGTALRSAAGSAVAQGISIATGLQGKFDWAGVAAAGVGAGIAGQIRTPGKNGWIVSNVAGGIAASAAESLVSGRSFGGTISKNIPSMIGNTIGNLVAEEINGHSRSGATRAGDGKRVEAVSDEIVVNPDVLAKLQAPARMQIAIADAGGDALKARETFQGYYGLFQSQAEAMTTAATGGSLIDTLYDASTGSLGYQYSGYGVNPPDFIGANGSIGNFVSQSGITSWLVNEAKTAAMTAALAQFDRQVGLGLAAPVLLGGGVAALLPALPSIAAFGGYEGSAGTMLQAAGLKTGIGLSIELGGNYATGSETTVGGLTGTVLASALIAPSVTRMYGFGAKGLTFAGGASGFGGNMISQGIDYANGHGFSATDLTLSTIFGLGGGRLAAPLQDRFGATSLLFQKWSPYVDELYNATATATGAISDITRKVMTPAAKRVFEGR